MPQYIETAKTYGGVGAESLPVLGFDFPNGQKIAVGATSTQSLTISSEIVCLKSTVDCHVVVGTNPTATTAGTNLYIFAGETFFERITHGHKIAVIAAGGTTGSLYVMPVI